MADHYFFDTSALVKRHVAEDGSKWVRSLLHAKAAHRVYVARVTIVEVTSAITRRRHRGKGGLSAAQAGAILGHFRRHLIQRYRVIDVTPDLFQDAAVLARKHRLRAYDAVQLAVALEVEKRLLISNLGPLILVSADVDLNKAAVAEGMTAEDPNNHP
jgi:predicted nucleic acid-binding protein